MIYIDYREEKIGMPKLLDRLSVPYTIKNLEVGDYAIGDILVERKEINDYIGSLISGHLEKQLYELSYNAELSYLVVEGYISEALMYRKIKRAPYISSLVGSSFKRALYGKQGQIVTVNLESVYDTALFLKYLHDKVMKNEDRIPRLVRTKKMEWTNKDVMMYILTSFPGVGEKKAEALLLKFKSLKNIVNASLEDLASVEGFGLKRAKEFNDIIVREIEENKPAERSVNRVDL
jgi:ERCC4-type nuclease